MTAYYSKDTPPPSALVSLGQRFFSGEFTVTEIQVVYRSTWIDLYVSFRCHFNHLPDKMFPGRMFGAARLVECSITYPGGIFNAEAQPPRVETHFMIPICPQTPEAMDNLTWALEKAIP